MGNNTQDYFLQSCMQNRPFRTVWIKDFYNKNGFCAMADFAFFGHPGKVSLLSICAFVPD